MPRSAGWSCWTTTSWWCLSPSASSVRRSSAGWPLPERTWRIRSLPLPTGGSCGSRPPLRLRYGRVGGLRPMARGILPGLVGNRLHLDAPLLGHAARRRQALEPVHRGPHHVVRVGGAQALGEDVAHAGALQHGTHRAPGDHAGTGSGRLEQHAPRAVVPDDLVGDRAAGERHVHHAASGRFDRFPYGFAHLIGLAGRHADVALPVAHSHERVEAEPSAAFDDFGDAVDRDDVLDVAIAFPAAAAAASPSGPAPACAAPATALLRDRLGTRLRRHRRERGGSRCRHGRLRRRLLLVIVGHQNSNPPLRAPSATAFTRPWYWYPPRSNTTRTMPFAFALTAISCPRAKLLPVFPLASGCTPSVRSEAPIRVTPRVSSTSWA